MGFSAWGFSAKSLLIFRSDCRGKGCWCQSRKFNNGWTEHQSLSHALFMLGKKMAIDLANQHPAVLVPEPFSDRLEVDSRHHGHAREVMTQVVKPKPFLPSLPPSDYEGLFQSLGCSVCFPSLRTGEKPLTIRHPSRGHVFQMSL